MTGRGFPTWRGLLVVIAVLVVAAYAVAAETSTRQVTFTKDVAPIMQQKCQECHQPGSIAPMSLITYDEARPWAKSIKDRVSTRQMPPWHIDRSVGVQKFKNDMSLTDDQIDTIVQWVDQGSQRGDPKDMPAPKPANLSNEWVGVRDGLGQPDVVVKSNPYTMAPQHQDVWWRPLSDIPITEPRWVKAVEVRPTNLQGRKIVHHAVAYLVLNNDPEAVNTGTGVAAKPEDLINARPMLMEWAIGKGYDLYRPNTGKLLLPGEQVSWDIHIHAVGEEITTGVEIGLWLYPKGQEPKSRSYLIGFSGLKGRGGLDIPPNTVMQSEGFTVLNKAAILENFQPHMHLRGKAMAVEAILPDGKTQIVSYVGKFNFNWMTNYIFTDDAAPAFPKGTMIHVIAWHDNTKANKFNPDPDQWVGYGDRTVDEMAHAWINVTYLTDDEYNSWVEQHDKTKDRPAQQAQR